MYEGKTCLITGGTGSWGHELTRKLLTQQGPPREIRIFSRNEYLHYQMQQSFSGVGALTSLIGDVRDFTAVKAACRGVDYVFHLAALKHVPICEAQPIEAYKTNVIGTQNVIRASLEEGVEKVIDVSTDKAVNPLNFYGITKAMGEKLMIHANTLSKRTRFVCIRGGNVLGTNGSVVPLFKRQIVENGEITLTDAQMTRFFLTISEAIDLLLNAAETAIGGETFVMKMKACNIRHLALVMAQAWSRHPVPIREIGIRAGEKMHEILVSQDEAKSTHELANRYYVILPAYSTSDLKHTYGALPRVTFTAYDSNANLLDFAGIRSLLQQGGFLP